MEGIKAAEKTFGEDIHALKGKMVHYALFAVTENTIEAPKELLK